MHWGKPKPAIVIGIDNTIVDTAYRKQKALEAMLNVEASIEQIRNDYDLTSLFGHGSQVAEAFFKRLDTAETISSYESPLFPGASDTIGLFRKDGYEVYFLTARHAGL